MTEIVSTDDLKSFAAYVGTLKNRIEALESSGSLTQTDANNLYALIAHSHAMSDVAGLVSALAGKEATGVAAGLVGVHAAAADPHPGYLTQAEADALYTGGASVGTAVIGFGASHADGASVTVTDPAVSATSYVNAWVQSNDSTVSNAAENHGTAAASLRFLITPGAGSFELEAHPIFGLATGDFKVRYSVQ